MTGSIPGMAGSEGAAGSGGLVLVLNSGSSSVKFALLTPDTGERVLGGLAEPVGTPQAVLRIRRYPGDAVSEPILDGSYQAVISRILDRLSDADRLADAGPHAHTGAQGAGPVRLIGVGHRVVHGGDRFSASTVVDDEVIAAIREFARLAPLHNPANLAGIEAISAIRPELPQVAVFDTAFHQTMPPPAFRYAVPEEWYTRYGVRRYGFHGTSHRFVSDRRRLSSEAAGELRLVTAHLGNGCSAAAVRDGVSVDTTMGLTPMEGLVMGTRSGDVDPGVFGYLASQCGGPPRSYPGAEHAERPAGAVRCRQRHAGRRGRGRARRRAGPARPRRLRAPAGQGDRRTGHQPGTARCAGLHRRHRGEQPGRPRPGRAGWGSSGLAEDPEATAGHGRSTGGRISRPGPVQALVVPTDEELMIARDTAHLIAARPAGVLPARR